MSKKRNKYSDPISTGVGIAQQDFQNQVGIRNEHDDDADLFASLGAMAGPKPRGAAALFSGFAKGAELGSRSQSTAKKQEALSKYDRVMDYFRTQNMEMEKRKQWEMQKEQEAEILRPYAVGGMEVSYSGMPYEQGNQAMRNVFEQLKVNNPKIKGDYLGYVPNSPLINIRDENGKDTVVSLSNFAGEDVAKRIQGEYIDKQRVGATFEGVEVQKFDKGIPSKFGQKGAEGNEFGSTPISVLQGKGGGAPLIATANAEMGIAKEVPFVLDMLDEAEDIIKNNPSLGSGWVNFTGSGNVTKGLLDNQTREAYEKLNKIANRVAETYIRAKGSAISDSERETIKKGLFDVTNLEGSNKYNINSVRKELGIAKERGDFAGDQLSKGLISTPKSFEKYKQSRQNQQVGGEDDIWNSVGTPAQ